MDERSNIDNALRRVYAGYIEEFRVNLLQHQLSLTVAQYRTGYAPDYHQLVFDGVSAFLFVEGEGEWRFNLVEWERAEISEVYYFHEPNDHVRYTQDKKGRPQYEAHPNFYLEIWSSPLLVEAKAIILDGIRYEVEG
jgi:hypothetical protein